MAGFMGQPLIANLFPYMGEVSVSDYWRVIDERNRYRATFMAAMEAKQFDAILSPACALPALIHGSSNYLLQDATYTIPYNLLGMPTGVVSVTRVRSGEESERPPSRQLSEQTASKVEQESVGLPLGVQVAAHHWREDIVLAVMAAIEEHFQLQPDYPAYPPV